MITDTDNRQFMITTIISTLMPKVAFLDNICYMYTFTAKKKDHAEQYGHCLYIPVIVFIMVNV